MKGVLYKKVHPQNFLQKLSKEVHPEKFITASCLIYGSSSCAIHKKVPDIR